MGPSKWQTPEGCRKCKRCLTHALIVIESPSDSTVQRIRREKPVGLTRDHGFTIPYQKGAAIVNELRICAWTVTKAFGTKEIDYWVKHTLFGSSFTRWVNDPNYDILLYELRHTPSLKAYLIQRWIQKPSVVDLSLHHLHAHHFPQLTESPQVMRRFSRLSRWKTQGVGDQATSHAMVVVLLYHLFLWGKK